MSINHKNPLLTVDTIIEMDEGIILIERLNPPYGWALPGGFVDYGESLETAAIREAKEETSLTVTLKEMLYAYSDPNRDPRYHTISVVFIGSANGMLRAADDAKDLKVYNRSNLPENIVFDHKKILSDYFRYINGESKIDIFFPMVSQ